MQITRRFTPLLLFLSCFLCTAFGAGERRPITPHDLWAMKRLSAPALSPDGKTVAFAVQEWSVAENKPTANLWLVDAAGGEPRRLTTAKASDSAPVWSPDGTRLAFVSKRGDDEAASLYLIPVHGGEAEKIVELPYGLAQPKWLPDGSGLVFITRVIPALAGKLAPDDLAAMKQELKRRKDSKMTAKVTEDTTYRYWDSWLTDNLANRLVSVNLADRTLRDLTPGFDRLFTLSGENSYDLAPDGRTIVLTLNSTPPPYAGHLNNDIYLLRADGSGALANLTPENPGDDSDPRFTADGKGVLFKRQETPYYCGEFDKLWRHDLATARNTEITDALDYSIGEFEPAVDGRTVWLTAEDKGAVPIFRLDTATRALTPVHATGTAGSIALEGGTLVFLHNTASRPDELFALDPATGAVRQLTHFNDALLATLDLGRVEAYWFDGAAGDRVHGWLFYPPAYDEKKTYPLVQLMHGGPHTMNRDSWSYRWNAHVFAAAGYVVTWVNRHGSTGFGEKFSQSILNEWGDKPLEDILKSTDYLLQKLPNLDPKRLAAAGASYGGYMAAWVAGHTDRFACIINHAGVSDFITQYGADITNYGFSKVLGGTPWNNPEGMQRNNPMTYAKNFKTPMLIIHGELDYRVPYVNGTALYGVYRAMGLPARLVIFPNENHWILSPQNSIYWNWEVQSWLARHIGGAPTLAEPRFDGKAD